MKRIVTIITAIVALQMASAQDGNNICVWNALNTYDNGGGPADLEGGMKCADLAAAHEATVGKSKTWFYRGKLYTKVFQDKTLKAAYGNAPFEAIAAFKRLYELNDPKFKDWDEVMSYLQPLATTTFNEGVDRFQAKDYAQAYKYFYAIKDLNMVMEDKGTVKGVNNLRQFMALKINQTTLEEAKQILGVTLSNPVSTGGSKIESYSHSFKDGGTVQLTFTDGVLTSKTQSGLKGVSGIDLTIALKNAAIAAENAGDINNAIAAYKDWLAIESDVSAYRGYVAALKKAGKDEEANKVLDEAIVIFPNDANLLVEKINVYLAAGQYAEALKYVNNLLSVEPNNDGALFIKGLAYEKIGNEDSVVYYYTRSAEVNPKNIKPWNNLGALYVNKANALVEQMNKLGNSKEDLKLYDELKKKRRDLYVQAKPYLLKAKEIEPDDAQINRTLKQVELYTAE